MRLLLVALALAFTLSGCVWTSGPDCSGACEKARDCVGLNKTFRLSCSNIGVGCADQLTADCADCIERHSCDELIQGACDGNVDAGQLLCLVLGPPAPDAGSPAPDAGAPAPDAGP